MTFLKTTVKFSSISESLNAGNVQTANGQSSMAENYNAVTFKMEDERSEAVVAENDNKK